MNEISESDLGVDAPNKVEHVLRVTADLYRQSAMDLALSWQEKNAGRIWTDFARILEKAADHCEKTRQKYGL